MSHESNGGGIHLSMDEFARLAMPSMQKSQQHDASNESGSQDVEMGPSISKAPAAPPSPPKPFPPGASPLVDLFAPPGSTPVRESAPQECNLPKSVVPGFQAAQTQHASNVHKQDDRPSTPPPLSPDDDSKFANKYEACPPSPSGLTWRKAGATFNLYPHTLISKKEKIRLEQLSDLPRLVKRNRAFHQSSNKVQLRHNQGASIYRLLRFNWFHVFLRWPTKVSILILLSVWTGSILIFALIYMWYDQGNVTNKCGLGGTEGQTLPFAGAFAFSLETCTTVGKFDLNVFSHKKTMSRRLSYFFFWNTGYGLPNGVNSYFEKGCPGLQIIIYFQMAWSMIFNAFLITFVYSRLGRSETRSIQVIFSDKALVSIVDGQVRFQVRLFDCDTKHPVVEAHVRMYCVMKHRPVPRPLRILQPDDELGAMLFLSFPNVVSHNIDMYSLLHPPVATMLMKPKGLVLRQVDGYTANRDDIICPVCGESYGTFDRWLNHVRYTQIVEKQDDFPIASTHRSLNLAEIEKEPYSRPIKDIPSLRQYFQNNVSEILCLVEGIDPMQSGTFQALQSYRLEDIQWETYAQFSPCLSIENIAFNGKDKIYSVALDRYHAIVPDPDAATAALEEDDEGYLKSEHIPNKNTREGAGKGKQIRKRHRRIKTLSSGISDSLFATPTPMPKRRTSTAGSAPPGIENL